MKALKVPTVSAFILRGWFLYARCMGAVFFRLKSRKDNRVVIQESCWNRSCWKWISIIWRLVPAGVHAYVYCSLIWHLANLVDRMLNFSRFVIITSCYLSIIHLQIFRGEELIRLANRYLRFFYRVTSLSIRSKTGFGGVRELGLILLSLCCQVMEIVFVLGLFNWGISLHNVVSWTSSTYVLIYTNMIIRISCIWYLSIGVLYSKLNDFLRLRRRRKQELRKAMRLFREMSYLVTSLQEISNKYLLLNLLQIFISMIALSYKMIKEQQFFQITIWFFFGKIMLDMLVLSFAIEGAVIQFSYTRDLTLPMFFLSELTEWNRTMEVFATHLNLYQFRVCLLGLFDVSNKFFPVVVTGMITYLVFVVQLIMQCKKNVKNVLREYEMSYNK